MIHVMEVFCRQSARTSHLAGVSKMAKKTLAGARGLDMIRHEGSFAGRAVSMRITVLTHLEREGDDKSYDVVVDQVAQALRSLGHDTAIVGVHADIRKLIDG